MRVSLKSYRTSRGDEGDAFSVVLLVDGKRVGEAWYDGNGGEYRYDFDITPNGVIPKAGIPTFTATHRATRDQNRKLFNEGIMQDAQTLGLYNENDGEASWSIVLEEIINTLPTIKRAKKWAKEGKPLTLAVTPPFSTEWSRADYAVYEFGGEFSMYGIGLPKHIDEVAALHPESRVTAFDGLTGEFVGVVYVGPAEGAWAAKNGYTTPDTAKGRAEVTRLLEAYKAGLLAARQAVPA